MGAIGVEVAKAGLFFGMDVRGLARTEPRDPVPSTSSATRRLPTSPVLHSSIASSTWSLPFFSDVEYFVGPETLPSFLDGCDYVVSLLPSTEETRGFLTTEKLAPCKGQVRSLANSDSRL
jgi:phosphoglycerate dehydrogenase-like enzyme